MTIIDPVNVTQVPTGWLIVISILTVQACRMGDRVSWEDWSGVVSWCLKPYNARQVIFVPYPDKK